MRMKEIFDGRWELGKNYTLVNIYNGQKITINYQQVMRLRNGKDTVSKIISRRIKNKTPYVTNNVLKLYKENKLRHMR